MEKFLKAYAAFWDKAALNLFLAFDKLKHYISKDDCF